MDATESGGLVWTWLEERGLDVTHLADMGFSAGVLNGTPHVSIPYVRNGERYLAKYRPAGSEKRFFCKPRGVKKSLWNVDCLRDPEFDGLPVVITEGELDAASCLQSGWARTVSIPDGWDRSHDGAEAVAHPGEKMRPLLEVEAALKAAPYVVIAADDDAVGAAFQRAVSALLDGCDVRYPVWPDGCKDANDVLRGHGSGALSECLSRAKRLDPPGCSIHGLDELPPMEGRRILRTGHRTLDRFAAFEIGALSISTGTPGSGKSTFATFISDQIRRFERVRIGLAMFETHPHRIREQLSKIAGATWDDQPQPMRTELNNWFRVVRRRDFETDNEAHDMLWIRTMVHSLAVRDQCKFIVIDPWNEIDHGVAPGETMTLYANRALARLRQWAEAFDCHIHLVAHPKKMGVSDDGRTRPPMGYDIADSAAFVNKPSLGFTVHNEDTDDGQDTHIIVWKVRDRELYGVQPGRTKLRYDESKMLWRELPH